MDCRVPCVNCLPDAAKVQPLRLPREGRTRRTARVAGDINYEEDVKVF